MSTDDPVAGDASDPTDLRTAEERHRDHVRIRRGRRRRRRFRRTGWLLLLAGGLMVVTAAWVGATALLARDQVAELQTHVTALRADLARHDLDAAHADVDRLAAAAHRAHSLTTGPAWWITSHLPAVGDPAVTLRGVTAAADLLASSALPALVDVSGTLDPDALRPSGSRLDVTAIAGVQPQLTAAVGQLRQVLYRVDRLPARTWLPSVDTGRTELLTQLSDLTGTLGDADVAARVAPTLLGQDGTRRYFVAFQNNAEARGGGGVPGAFGILQATDGVLTFTHFGNEVELVGTPADVDLGADFDAHYADWDPTAQYLNSTVSPNFPDAARIWVSMWEEKTGQTLDGALSIDPTALSYLLAATGPAILADGTSVGADNVVQLTQQTVYSPAVFSEGDNAARRAYLLEVAQAVDRRLVSGSGSVTDLVTQARRAVDEHRLQLWSADPAVAAVLSGTAIAGEIPVTDRAFSALAINQARPSKLDYYLGATTTWVRSGCGATRDVTVTVALRNDAPASGLSTYVTGLPDDVVTTPGDDYLLLDYLATTGAGLTSMTVDGTPVAVATATEAGHPSFRAHVLVPRGGTTTVVFHLREPAAAGGAPIVRVQPLVQPMTVVVRDTPCP